MDINTVLDKKPLGKVPPCWRKKTGTIPRMETRIAFTLPDVDIEHRQGEVIITEHLTGRQTVVGEDVFSKLMDILFLENDDDKS
jgi:hypothetical protein